MSAFVFDRVAFETKSEPAVPAGRKCPRDEEFRAALDRYMADYIACQKRRDIGHPGGAQCPGDSAIQDDAASSAPAGQLRRCLSCRSAPW